MRFNVLLWIVQGLLTCIFLLAGGMKLILPLEALQSPIPLPGPFLRFICGVEVLGNARSGEVGRYRTDTTGYVGRVLSDPPDHGAN